MKKALAVLMTLCLMLTAVGALADSAAVNDPGALPIVNDPVTLTIGVEQSATIEDWETNEETLYLEDKTGISLDFVVYPSNEMGTKLELIVAAGGSDLPDMLMGSFTQNQIMPWAEAGMIQPLTEYYDNLVYWAAQNLEGNENYNMDVVRRYITSYDGEIYGFFSLNTTENNQYSGTRINFYVPWLEKLGLEKPTTMEDFYNVLVAFRDQDPNGNGEADEIPLTCYSDGIDNLRRALMTPFVYTQTDYWTVDDNGTIGVSFNTDEWREGLRFVRKLFAEGLADPAMFTQDQAAMTVTLSQETQVVGAFGRFSSTCMSATDLNRYNYDRQDYFTGFDGETVAAVKPSIPSLTALITKNCANPEAAFMLCDYLTSTEMSIITRFGYEGDTYTVVDQDAVRPEYENFWANVAAYNYPEIYYGDDTSNYYYMPLNEFSYDASLWGTLQNKWWAQVGPNIMTEETNVRFTISGNIGTEIEQASYVNEYRARHALNDAKQYRDDSKIVAGLVYTEDEQEVITDYYSEIKTYVETMWASYATGTADIEDDAAWNEYISQLEKMGLADCIEATQTCYDRMNG